jgi:hypothetical protein
MLQNKKRPECFKHSGLKIISEGILKTKLSAASEDAVFLVILITRQ